MSNKSKLTPKLRFPEFAKQPHRDVRLQDVTAECTTRNGDELSSESVMGVSKVDGMLPMQARLIGSDLARYKLVRKNWFAYNPMRLNIGSIARWKYESEVLVSPDYVVFRCSEEPDSGIDPEYLDQFRRSEQWEDFVTESGDGSVRVRIYYKDISRIPLKLPPLPEQQKIADCLSSLDELIAAGRRKLESLRAYKKGMMQQLFPRDGETTPRLRFPEFRADHQSGFKLIGEFAEVTTGGKDTQNKVDDGAYPFFVRSQNVERIDSFSHDGEAVLTSDDGVGVGENYHYINGKCDFHQRVYCIYDFDENASARFFFHYFSLHFKKRVKAMSAKNSVDSVRMSMITEMSIWFPAIAEQQRIAECLTSLDGQITAQSEKLDALRTHKKGLLQQLFPSAAEEKIHDQ